MNVHNALTVIENMKKWAIVHKLSLLLVGSVGYRSALIRNSELEKCDDMDCIFIYDDIEKISESPFYDSNFYNTVCSALPDKADMFSVKLVINGIKISADFVSSEYLRKLSLEEITGISKYRLKLTNAVEVPDNTYCDFYGRKTCYHKSWEEYKGYRIYKLPVHLFVNHIFFQGVLLSKYVFNPAMVVLNEMHRKYIYDIQHRVKAYCPEDGSLCNAYYKCEDFSEETKKFLKDREE